MTIPLLVVIACLLCKLHFDLQRVRLPHSILRPPGNSQLLASIWHLTIAAMFVPLTSSGSVLQLSGTRYGTLQ